MGIPQIPIGIGPPNTLDLTILQDDSELDLTTVTGVSLQVTRSLDGSTATWACTIRSASAGQLVASYPFASGGGDVPVLGTYEIAPMLTVPGGVVPCYAVRIQAVDPGQLAVRSP